MEIRLVDPQSVRESVAGLFWEHRQGPGTTEADHARLWDWRYRSLGDGEPLVWVAQDGGRVVGHIALFPRQFRLGDVRLRGAVSGGLLVRRDRRHTLLGLQLLGVLLRYLHQGALDFVVSLPNPISYRLSTKLGFHDLGALYEHLDLRRPDPVLRRRLSSGLIASTFGPSVGGLWTLRRSLRQRRLRECAHRLRVEKIDTLDTAYFDRSHWTYPPDRLVGVDSAGYIHRRFLLDPLTRRSLYTLRDAGDGRLEGYVVVEFRRGRAAVCDARANAAVLDEASAIALVAPHLPRETEVLAVPALPDSRLAAELRALGFVARAPQNPEAPGVRVTALWRPQHPQAPELVQVERWNLYVGAADA